MFIPSRAWLSKWFFFRSQLPVNLGVLRSQRPFLFYSLWECCEIWVPTLNAWKAAVQPQSCCQQENLVPVLSADLYRFFFFFPQEFIKQVPLLWASSLDYEIAPWCEWQRSAAPEEATEVRDSCHQEKYCQEKCLQKKCHQEKCLRFLLVAKDEDSFHRLAACIPRDALLTSLIFTFQWMTQPHSSNKAKEAQSFQLMTLKCEEKASWNHTGGGETIPISCLWSPAFSLATCIWISPQH